MHDLLLAHQDALTLEDLGGYARQLGLDQARFSDDLESRRFALGVARDVQSAEASGVAGTPTFFINGRRHYGATTSTPSPPHSAPHSRRSNHRNQDDPPRLPRD